MKKYLIYIIPTALPALIIVVCALCFSACYTLKQGVTMIGLLRSAVPLEKIAQDSGAGEADKEFVRRVEDIKRFAFDELQLTPTKNYSTYVTLDRDYLAAIVSASAKDSFTRYEWWFPVVGSVPYKGFFKADDAKQEARKLAKKDLDVWIRPVDAFSTLGWFRDPLYSFMKDYSEYRLADLILHESFHATVFFKSNMQFNEEIAAFIGSEGARLYIEKNYGPDAPELKAMEQSEAENARFVQYIQGIIAELKPVYASALDREEKLARKAEVISAAQKRFLETYDTMFSRDNYKGFGTMTINNAYLELYRLYYERGGKLRELYRACGSDIKKFIALAKQIDGKSDPMVQLENLVRNGDSGTVRR